MPAEDIIRIATTSALVQAVVSMTFMKLIYSQENYQRLLSQYERSKAKRDKIVKANFEAATKEIVALEPSTAKNKKAEREMQKRLAEESAAQARATKKIQRAKDEHNEISSRLLSKHSFPNFLNSIIFLVLGRILSTEYSSKVVAVLPFVPYSIIRRISQRGFDEGMDPRACSFYFVFILCSLSVKHIADKVFGQQLPPGISMANYLDSPKAQKLMEKYGFDTEELNEVRSKLA